MSGKVVQLFGKGSEPIYRFRGKITEEDAADLLITCQYARLNAIRSKFGRAALTSDATVYF